MRVKKKILFYHEQFPSGGAERVTMDIAQFLADSCFEMHLIVSRLAGEVKVLMTISEMPGHYTLSDSEAWDYIVSYISDNDIDIFVLPITPCYALLEKIRCSTSCRIVFAHHGMPLYEAKSYKARKKLKHRKNFLKWLEYYVVTYPKMNWLKVYDNRFGMPYKKTYDVCDAFVVLCDAYREEWRKYMHLTSKSDKLVVIPNSERKVADVNFEKKNMVLYSGRMSHGDKRVDRLLKIWKTVSRLALDWNLVLVGDGPDFAAVKDLASSLELERVSFVGYVPDVTPYYRDAAILCLTSEWEGWGLSLTEAQANGVVPIAMNCSAGVETVLSPSGVNGILVPHRDLDAFAAALLDLMNDPQKLAEMSRNVVRKAEDYDVELTRHKWLALFDRLAE